MQELLSLFFSPLLFKLRYIKTDFFVYNPVNVNTGMDLCDYCNQQGMAELHVLQIMGPAIFYSKALSSLSLAITAIFYHWFCLFSKVSCKWGSHKG
jgi:hypothetical protein